MVSMPRGEPRSVPDPDGERYDDEMRKLRSTRMLEEGAGPPAAGAAPAQHGLRISHPNTLESFIPVVGPAWEAAADFQDGDYWGAAGNTVLAAADVIPAGAVVKGVRAASKGIGLIKKGAVTAGAARKAIRRAGLARPGQEIHHSFALNGLGRNVQNWRNHYAFLKVLDQEPHRRLTGGWKGKPRYDPLRRFLIGTPDWMKTPANIVGHAADAVFHVDQSSSEDD